MELHSRYSHIHAHTLFSVYHFLHCAQEAEALTELEKKVKASNDLLDRKERGLTLLQAFSGKEVEHVYRS